MLDQGGGLEASPRWVRRQFLTDSRASKLKGNMGTLTKKLILLMKFLAVPDANTLIVNIELTNYEVRHPRCVNHITKGTVDVQ